MQTIYSTVDMSTQLRDNDVVVLITDLKSGATFHHVWNKDLLPTAPTLTDKERWSMADLIVKQYALAQTLSTEDEQALIYQTETTIVREYVQTSQVWKTGLAIGHNTIHALIESDGRDFAFRFVGSSHHDTVTKALEGNQQAVMMAYDAGFLKPNPSNPNMPLTMMGVKTAGTRTYAKRSGFGSNFTPKKKKRK